MSENQTIERRKRIFSGIQPTGTLTLGNYIGALWKMNMTACTPSWTCTPSLCVRMRRRCARIA